MHPAVDGKHIPELLFTHCGVEIMVWRERLHEAPASKEDRGLVSRGTAGARLSPDCDILQGYVEAVDVQMLVDAND